MKNNLFFKFITSIPIVLLALYFIPFLGVCLLLFRFYLRKKNDISTTFIVLGLLLFVPRILESIFKTISFDSSKIPYFDTIVSSSIYDKLFFYGKVLVTVGVLVLVFSYIFRNLITKITSKVKSGVQDYIQKEEQRDREIKEKNDMLVRERQEAVKNMHTVTCPHCGADNVLTSKVGKCKYCRRTLEYKE